MKTRVAVVAVAAAICAAASVTGADFNPRRVGIGVRVTRFALQDDRHDTFLGTINELSAEQDYAPWKVFVDWTPIDNFGLELTWDRVCAKTGTMTQDRHSDGTFSLAGPILTARWQMENRTAFTPYVGAGLAWMFADFEPEAWWELGYSSPADYDFLNRPDERCNRMWRSMDVSDSVGFVADGGLDFAITRRWSLNLYARYMHVETDTFFSEYRVRRLVVGKSESIPFSNYAFGIGVRYSFEKRAERRGRLLE